MNHVDPSPLAYLSNGGLWRRKYGNSMERWLKEAVAPDLQSWGFNSLGWNQEVVTRGASNHRHSRHFTAEEYQWLGMPYCHQLPFADFHQWENETRNPDFFSSEFVEWCDHVAREHCVRLADDPMLIGYFYIDCPTWIHTRPHTRWKGPLFDPAKLSSESGKQELFAMATQYYRVTHEAVRRYDPNHLILGDRYEANQPIAETVVHAALPYVDVLSFQHFSSPEKVVANLRHWHHETGKPVLLADHATAIKQPDGVRRHDGAGYTRMLEALQEVNGCVGYHLCGAYLQNRVRKRGLRDSAERPDREAIEAITAANQKAQVWMEEAGAME